MANLNQTDKGRFMKPKESLQQSVSSSRIQGFGPISNATNTQFVQNPDNLSSNKDQHQVSHHDFTIEEKLHEESYLSKEKTMEYKAPIGE
jgi:hypothetical protein